MPNETESSQQAKTEAIDPICGMKVAVSQSSLSWLKNGEQFYFCSKHCLTKFQNEQSPPPQQHDQESKPEPIASRSSANQYTCPMHPQIVSDKFGTCPICGMSLEPLKISSQDDALEQAELTDWRNRFLLSLVFTVPLLSLEMVAE